MLFDAATLAQLRKTQESTMMHECTIEPYTVGEDGTISYGKAVESVCGFQHISVSLRPNNDLYEVIEANAEMRLPFGTAIGMRDRVTLTKSFGNEVSPVQRFEVIDCPDNSGPSGQVVKLREIYL